MDQVLFQKSWKDCMAGWQVGVVWLFCFWAYFESSCECCFKVCKGQHSEVEVAGPLKDALVVLQEELAKDEPVTINGATTSTWTVYTDGAFEPDGEVRASVGGSACQTGWSGDGVLRFEAAWQFNVRSWKRQQAPNLRAWIFPILLALSVWQSHLLDAQIVF